MGDHCPNIIQRILLWLAERLYRWLLWRVAKHDKTLCKLKYICVFCIICLLFRDSSMSFAPTILHPRFLLSLLSFRISPSVLGWFIRDLESCCCCSLGLSSSSSSSLGKVSIPCYRLWKRNAKATHVIAALHFLSSSLAGPRPDKRTAKKTNAAAADFFAAAVAGIGAAAHSAWLPEVMQQLTCV